MDSSPREEPPSGNVYGGSADDDSDDLQKRIKALEFDNKSMVQKISAQNLALEEINAEINRKKEATEKIKEALPREEAEVCALHEDLVAKRRNVESLKKTCQFLEDLKATKLRELKEKRELRKQNKLEWDRILDENRKKAQDYREQWTAMPWNVERRRVTQSVEALRERRDNLVADIAYKKKLLAEAGPDDKTGHGFFIELAQNMVKIKDLSNTLKHEEEKVAKSKAKLAKAEERALRKKELMCSQMSICPTQLDLETQPPQPHYQMVEHQNPGAQSETGGSSHSPAIQKDGGVATPNDAGDQEYGCDFATPIEPVERRGGFAQEFNNTEIVDPIQSDQSSDGNHVRFQTPSTITNWENMLNPGVGRIGPTETIPTDASKQPGRESSATRQITNDESQMSLSEQVYRTTFQKPLRPRDAVNFAKPMPPSLNFGCQFEDSSFTTAAGFIKPFAPPEVVKKPDSTAGQSASSNLRQRKEFSTNLGQPSISLSGRQEAAKPAAAPVSSHQPMDVGSEILPMAADDSPLSTPQPVESFATDAGGVVKSAQLPNFPIMRDSRTGGAIRGEGEAGLTFSFQAGNDEDSNQGDGCTSSGVFGGFGGNGEGGSPNDEPGVFGSMFGGGVGIGGGMVGFDSGGMGSPSDNPDGDGNGDGGLFGFGGVSGSDDGNDAADVFGFGFF